MNYAPNGNGIWRWLAIFLSGVVIASLPAAIVVLTAPDQADYDVIQQEVNDLEVQVVRLEEQLMALIAALEKHAQGG